MKVWIVQGSSGEYSDRNEWIVAVCLNEEAAKALENKCSDYIRELGLHRDGYGSRSVVGDVLNDHSSMSMRYQIEDAINKGLVPDAPDHRAQFSYTGTDYCYYAADVRGTESDWAAFFDGAVAEKLTC